MSIPDPVTGAELLTAEEFLGLPEEPGWLVELVRGQVVREGAPAVLHGRLQSRIAYHLEAWMERRGEGGVVAVHAGFLLARGPDTVRIPDVAYVASGRIPEGGYGVRVWSLGPDLVVEVTSPSNSWTDVQERVADYLAAGTRLVWVVDPPTHTATVYRRGAAAERLDASGVLQDPDVLPDFGLEMGRLFDV